MITAVLDQTIKLFGRGFLLAALVPMLLFGLGVIWLVWGPNVVGDAVEEFTTASGREAVTALVLGLMALYLFAYVLYGVRAGLHSVYQGVLPRPLAPLARPGLALATRRVRQLTDELQHLERAQDMPDWATRREEPFLKAYSVEPIDAKGAAKLLESAERRHATIVAGVESSEPCDERGYLEVLADVHRLQAHGDELDNQLEEQVERVASELHAAYVRFEPLQRALAHHEATTRRAWLRAYNALYSSYPDDEALLRPTRMGNVMSALEAYPLERYGIELATLWPRLEHVVSEHARGRIDERNIYLDFTVTMSALALAIAAVGTGVAVADSSRPIGVRLALPLAALAVFWLFYLLSLVAGRSFASEVQAAVDLFRLKLLDALGIEPPKSADEERHTWEQLRALVAQAEAPTWRLRARGEPPPGPDTAGTGALDQGDGSGAASTTQ